MTRKGGATIDGNDQRPRKKSHWIAAYRRQKQWETYECVFSWYCLFVIVAVVVLALLIASRTGLASLARALRSFQHELLLLSLLLLLLLLVLLLLLMVTLLCYSLRFSYCCYCCEVKDHYDCIVRQNKSAGPLLSRGRPLL